MTSEPQTETIEKTWPDYRAVWRWHFYASLFCIPFVVILSISGAIYLFKDEVESWQDRPYDNLVVQGKPATAAAQIRAALAAVPEVVARRLRDPRVRPRGRSGARAGRQRRGPPRVCASRHAASAPHRRGGRATHERRQEDPRRALERRSRVDGGGIGRLLDDRDGHHGALSLVAATRARTGRRVISAARRRPADVLARSARRDGDLDLDIRPVSALDRPALGKIVGELFQGHAAAHGDRGGPAGLDHRQPNRRGGGEGDSGGHSGHHSSSGGRPRGLARRRGISRPSIGSWPPCGPWTCRRPW